MSGPGDDPEQHRPDEVADGLREAARRLAALELPDAARDDFHRRLAAVADSVKLDSASVSRRLRALLSDLDERSV